jgi:hypothetical protein
MKEEIEVLTTWATEVTPAGDTANVARLLVDFNFSDGDGVVDITAQRMDNGNVPPSPNTLVARVWADTAVIDAIEADPNYVIMPGTRKPYNG